MRLVEQVNRANNLVGLTKLSAILTIQGSFVVLDLLKLFQGSGVLVKLQAEKGDVPLDFTDLGTDLVTVVVFVDAFYDPQTV